jgi:hypothetical protein
MRRRVVNVLAVVSAVVCVLSLMLVGRSVFRSDRLAVPIGQNNTFWAATIDGQLVIISKDAIYTDDGTTATHTRAG